jgi:hypothetical protein
MKGRPYIWGGERSCRGKYSVRREKVTLGWRALGNENFVIFTLPDIIRRMKSRWVRLVGYVAHMGEKVVYTDIYSGSSRHNLCINARNMRLKHNITCVCIVLVGKSEGRRLLRKPRHR